MSEQILIKNFTATGEVQARRIVYLSSEGHVAQARANVNPIGVNTGLKGEAEGRVDIGLIGIFEIEAGERVVAGAAIASNASGQAVTHSNQTSPKIGKALTNTTAAGDILRAIIISQ